MPANYLEINSKFKNIETKNDYTFGGQNMIPILLTYILIAVKQIF